MIESILTSQSTTDTKRVLTYVKNERMGGYVPKYETIKANKTNISQNIEASLGASKTNDSLAYTSKHQKDNEQQFGFSDLIDMMNPLHHFPIVGHVYRELTGDDIKPISKIIGSAAFSGPIGVAAALIDTVVTKETGKDMVSNAINTAFNNNNEIYGETQIAQKDKPEETIENAIKTIEDYEMNAALLAYSDLGQTDEAALKYEAYKNIENAMKTPAKREPITQISFSNKKSGLYSL